MTPELLVKDQARAPQTAYIRETECIGCTKCIQACPVDAIIGSAKQIHTVLVDECIGCNLCVPPCPVDCIEMHDIPQFTYQIEHAQQRLQAKQQREQQHAAIRSKKLSVETNSIQINDELAARRDYIQAAIERAKMKKK